MIAQQRVKVVNDILGNLLDRGMTHSQVKMAVTAMAEAAVNMPPEDLVVCMQADDSEAGMSKLANVTPGPAAASLLAVLATQIAGWGGSRLGKVTDSITAFGARAAPTALVAAPLALAGGAYLAGRSAAEMASDDASQIKEIQHQEMVAALRRNAENYRRHGKGQQDGNNAG